MSHIKITVVTKIICDQFSAVQHSLYVMMTPVIF